MTIADETAYTEQASKQASKQNTVWLLGVTSVGLSTGVPAPDALVALIRQRVERIQHRVSHTDHSGRPAVLSHCMLASRLSAQQGPSRCISPSAFPRAWLAALSDGADLVRHGGRVIKAPLLCSLLP